MFLAAAGNARTDVAVGCCCCSCSAGIEEESGVRTENSGPETGVVGDESFVVVTVTEGWFSDFVFLSWEAAVVGDTSMVFCDVDDCSTGFTTVVNCDVEKWSTGSALGVCDAVVAGASVAACEAELVTGTAFCSVVIVAEG